MLGITHDQRARGLAQRDRAAHAAAPGRARGRARARRAADDRQGLRLLRHARRGRHGAAARHRRPARGAHAHGRDGAGAAAPVHALPGVRRGVRQRARRPARAPAVRRAAERRRRQHRPARAALPGAPRARDQAARPPADGDPAPEGPHGDRGRRVRLGRRASSRWRTCSRRSSARSTTSSIPRTRRSCASGPIATGSRAACRSRSSTSASSASSPTRTTTRSAASSSASSAARRRSATASRSATSSSTSPRSTARASCTRTRRCCRSPRTRHDDDEDGDALVSYRPARGGAGMEIMQVAPLTVVLIAINVIVYYSADAQLRRHRGDGQRHDGGTQPVQGSVDGALRAVGADGGLRRVVAPAHERLPAREPDPHRLQHAGAVLHRPRARAGARLAAPGPHLLRLARRRLARRHDRSIPARSRSAPPARSSVSWAPS